MRLFEVAVMRVENDLAVEEVEHVDLEFGREVYGEPDAVGLRCVSDCEAETRHIAALTGPERQRLVETSSRGTAPPSLTNAPGYRS